MHKYRSWLLGLGIGIILGASMLQLILMAKGFQASVKDGSEAISREQLESYAREQGLALYPAGEKRYTENELAAKIEEALSALPKQNDSAQGEASPKADAEAEPSASAKPSTEPSGSTPSGSTEEKSIRVEYNDTLVIVAGKLKDAGIIDDEADFLKQAKSISKKLKVGTSTFTGKPTYKEIMTQLTGTK